MAWNLVRTRRSVGAWLLAALVFLASAGSAQTTVPPQYFGMHLVKSHPWPTVSFGSLRLWDTDTRWQQMNPASGVYDFSTLDTYLALARAHAVFDIVLVLGGTPNWISSDPSNTVCDYAAFAGGSCAPPSDLNPDGTGTNQAWRNFIYQLTSHIAGLERSLYSPVTGYEMWNEFSRSTESWTGTSAQMGRMTQDAYCILKGSGPIAATGESCAAKVLSVAAVGMAPHAIVISPSAQASGPDVYVLGSYFSNRGSAATGIATATDVVAVHNYTYGNACCATPEALITQWSALQMALPADAAGIPVWSTEGSWGDTASKEPDPDMQAAYVARSHLLGWSLGFRRMYWYAWGNSWGRLWSQSGVNGCSDQGSGRGCLSPAAQAYAEVYSWMVGNTMTNPCTAVGSVYACQLTTSDGTTTLAVWDAAMSCARGSCSRSVFRVPLGYSAYLDLAHVRHNLQSRTMWISAKPVLLLSGSHTSRASTHQRINRPAAVIGVTRTSPFLLPIKATAKTVPLH